MKKFYLVCLGVVLLDRITKYVTIRFLDEYQSVPIINNVFHLTYLRNPGAAFGILSGQRWFFVLVTLAVVALILLYIRQVRENGLLQLAFGLQLGGALGNLVDRLAHADGKVIDFLDFRIWPVFNIADSAIVIGVALFALDVLREWKSERYEA